MVDAMFLPFVLVQRDAVPSSALHAPLLVSVRHRTVTRARGPSSVRGPSSRAGRATRDIDDGGMVGGTNVEPKIGFPFRADPMSTVAWGRRTPEGITLGQAG